MIIRWRIIIWIAFAFLTWYTSMFDGWRHRQVCRPRVIATCEP